MADHLALLENKLDERYLTQLEFIADAGRVTSWDDYNFRAGYLKAIRDVGVMIKEVRAPESVPSEGIPDVLTQQEAEFIDG
jgi:hypothetical protein